MKTKKAFITNSSSSSFIIIGEELFANEITDEMIDKSQVLALGCYLCNGQDLFKVTREMFNVIKDNPNHIWELIFIRPAAHLSSGDRLNLDLLSDVKVPIICSGECDHHETDNVQAFVDRYL